MLLSPRAIYGIPVTASSAAPYGRDHGNDEVRRRDRPAADAETIRSAGADYVEPTIVGNVLIEDADGGWVADPGYDQPAAPSFAILLPGSIRLSDPAFDPAIVTDYLQRALSAVGAVALPGAKVVLGSGAARTIPDGVPADEGRVRFAVALRQARDIARQHDLRIILEPLHADETNLLNSIAEAVAFLDEHAIDGVPVVADIFHIMTAGGPLSVVAEHAGRIGHVHLADTGRRAPGTGDWPISELVAIVAAAGYDGDLTIECHWDDLAAELPAALAYVREAAGTH